MRMTLLDCPKPGENYEVEIDQILLATKAGLELKVWDSPTASEGLGVCATRGALVIRIGYDGSICIASERGGQHLKSSG